METLTAPSVQPFAVAALIMLGLVGVEILSTLVGVSLSELMGKDSGLTEGQGAADHGLLGGALSWINPSGVPLLILLIVMLAFFAATGYALQSFMGALLGPLPVWAASLIACLAVLPLTRSASRVLARVIPRDETYAIGEDDLVGRVAEVTLGPLDQGAAGRVKVLDRHGNWHFPMARAARGEAPIATGAQVLLVDRNGTTFLAIPAPETLRTPRSQEH
jgi:hypothetical protein